MGAREVENRTSTRDEAFTYAGPPIAFLLDGICEEVAALLADMHCPRAVFDVLQKMEPLRQIEATELLIRSNNFSTAHASPILAGTPPAQLIDGCKAKPKRVSSTVMARVERELAGLQEAVGSAQQTYSSDNLHLTVTSGYPAQLLASARVTFSEGRCPEFSDRSRPSST